ncbi:MAG: D-galactosyl-beta-3-N-acetyl-D-hexosamine phosphorylase [Eubacterium sp.]|nr:D-galactosyl-beta-3-N-acetyl-D-hexosamine phosphorylase [Eubacterium sp.]
MRLKAITWLMEVKMTKNPGRVTLPAEKGMEEEILRIAEKWGVDAVRDSDGTKLSDEILNMGFDIYSTLCLIREDNAWTKANRDCLQQTYLLSEPVIAAGNTIKVDLMKGYFSEQFQIDSVHDPKIWWEVIDRTTGDIVPAAQWAFEKDAGIVTINNALPWHKYTVSFLACQIWEPVSMYNHITNQWKEEHRLPVDPRHPKARKHLLEVLEKWLEEHPGTDIVRFTTFFYNFDLIYNENGRERQVDWFGYLSCVSPSALQNFKKEYGYRLRPEDFIDNGYYNTPFKVPSGNYLDWMDFNQKFIAGFAKECVDMVHKAGKKAIMFLGDHWAGTEPYGKYFGEIGLDAVVGAAGDGVTTRMISDIPVKATEARFYPYFFPDIFYKGGNPVKESMEVWRKSRRALLRKPTDRMGYGGYLSLAAAFPDFVEHIGQVCDEFRRIHQMARGTKPLSAPFKVAVLNAWGHIRTWMTHQVAHSLWNQRCYSYLGIMEALAGLPFDLEFISFEDIRQNGISEDTGVIINAGDAGTSWSGAEYWKDEEIVTAIRSWVYNGGGFIGVGEPSAYEYNGSFFQLSDVLGVQKETGYSVSHNKPSISVAEKHFITADIKNPIDFGEGMNCIYKCSDSVEVLALNNLSCSLTVNGYGNGRSVYIAGLPFNMENTRLLSRAIYWTAHKEAEMQNWYSDNPEVECAVYPETGCFVAVNNSGQNQLSSILKPSGDRIAVQLEPMGYKWFEI